MSAQTYPAYPNQQGLVQGTQNYNTAANGSFSTSLCSWCGSPGGCGVCMSSTFCCCCQYGKNVEKLGPQATCGGSCCGAGLFYCIMFHFGLHVVPQCITRSEIRRMNGMQPAGCSDCLTSWCCLPCGLCQEAREIKIRGGGAGGKGGAVYTSAPQAQTMHATQQY